MRTNNTIVPLTDIFITPTQKSFSPKIDKKNYFYYWFFLGFSFLFVHALPAFSVNLTIGGKTIPSSDTDTCNPPVTASPGLESICFSIPTGDYGDFSIERLSESDFPRNETIDGSVDVLRTTGLKIISDVNLLSSSISAEYEFSSPPPLPDDPDNKGLFQAKIEGFFGQNGDEDDVSVLLSRHFLNGKLLTPNNDFDFNSEGLGRTNFMSPLFSKEVTLNEDKNTLKHIVSFVIEGQGSFIAIPGSQVTSISTPESSSTFGFLVLSGTILNLILKKTRAE